MSAFLGNTSRKSSKAKKSKGSALTQAQDVNWLPILAMAGVGLSSLSLMSSLFLGVSFWKIANKEATTLVQLEDGSAIQTEEKDKYHRSIKVIQDFTKKELSMLLTWTGRTIDDNGLVVPDKGRDWNGKKIPTRMYSASFGLSPNDGFRDGIMDTMAKWHSGEFLAGQRTQTLDITHVYRPKQISRGKWSVGVIATRTRTSSIGEAEYIPFRRTIYLEAVEPVDLILKETATPEQKAFHELRESGLQIYQMRKLRAD